MSDIETFLAEVEERANKATPGSVHIHFTTEQGGRGWNIYTMDGPDHASKVHQIAHVTSSQDDAWFYAHAHSDVPRLLQIVRAQQLADGLNTVAFRALQEIVQAMQAEKQAVIDGMTRAITAEGKANEAFYTMQAERDALRERVGKLEKAGSELVSTRDAYVCAPIMDNVVAGNAYQAALNAFECLIKGSNNGSTEAK